MRLDHGNGNRTEGITDIPVIKELFDDTPNINDKSVVVPDNELWHINFVQAIFVTTSTVGNRLLALEVTNSDGNIILTVSASINQAASLTRIYTGFQGQFRETSFLNDEIHQPIPIDFYLTPSSTIRFYDTADIDGAGDDLTIAGQYKCYVGG
jgi:hypothetical protein